MANINHFDLNNYRVFETEIAGRKLTVETGKMAQLANGSCLVRYGETAVLVTATASAKPRDGIDFFPLSVDFEERMYAVGRIPGSFMRREGRPSEKAILSSRQIDRPMRPLFPKDLRNDVSIVCTVLENDYDNSPEVVALLGASIAVSISDIPFDYVVAGCQVGIVDGKTVINPTSEQRKVSEMDVTLCATKDKIVMIEAGAKEVPEDEMFNALMEAHEELKKVCAFIQSIKDEIGKPKFEYEHHDIDHDLFDKLEAACNDKFEVAMDTDDKTVRDAGVREIVDAFSATLDEAYLEEHDANLAECVDKLQKKIVRRWLANGKRVDGRGMEEVRPLAKGDRVRLLNVGGVIATVLAAPDRDGSVQVQAGPMKMTVKVNEVRLVEEKKAAPKPKMQPRRDAPRRELNLRSAESEVDVRGMSAEEALFEVDNFLSRAIMAGLPSVTVIHGKGTGVLRTAVQQHLRKNKRVKSVRSGVYGEGEQGVTIVELR